MNFEEFKKDWERFSPIDTPEKLAICESQYRRFILSEEDQNYFEPVETIESTDKYYQQLTIFFGLDKAKEGEFYFFIIPSFKPEYLLTIRQHDSQYILTYQTLHENYWSKYRLNHNALPGDFEINKITINSQEGALLVGLLTRVIRDSRKPEVGRIVLDGEQYFLATNTGDELIKVTQHSPRESSYSGKVIKLMLRIIAWVKGDNTITIVSLLNEINELLTL